MRAQTVKLILALTLLVCPWATRHCAGAIVGATGSLTLSWTASADPTVTGYYVVWGVSSGVYTSTNSVAAPQTSNTVTGLASNEVYYFNLAAYNSSGMVSPYVGEITYELTNTTVASANEGTTNPPVPGTLSTFVASTNGATTAGNAGGTTGLSSNSTAASGTTAALFWGVPPFLTIAVSNGQPNLNIGGTVGATMMIEGTTNIFSVDSWETMTNVALTNIAPVAQTNQSSQAQDALDLAFVPAAQEVPMTPGNASPFQYFRAVMPYDYVILADLVLTGQGYTPRLILVNMPGIVSDDACYVTEGSSFIHYDRANYALQLEGSGPTIRAIATTLANSLNLDWTSASEFTYSNGVAEIVSTVVQTEPPSSDPVPGKAPAKPSIAINF